MNRDPIVDEVRAIREQLSAQCYFDIAKIVEDAQRRQATSQSKVVAFRRRNSPQLPSGVVTPVLQKFPLTRSSPTTEL
jgi:hypothetical protein